MKPEESWKKAYFIDIIRELFGLILFIVNLCVAL